MFAVYKITNNTNNKSYIGSSIRVNKRWRDHINTSNNENSPHYNYPLYQAFRKYGIENFSFEVIKDDFESLEQMEQYEHDMIIYYDAYNNGYNQTLNTSRKALSSENLQKHIQKISQKCAKIDINNNILEIYDSYHDAARKNGYDGDNRASSIRDVCKGKESSINGLYFRDLDENGQIVEKPFKSYKGKKPLIGINVNNPDEEIYFSSVSEAAQKLSADRQSIGKCIKGDQRYSIVKGYIFRELDINGNIIENDISIDDRIEEYNRTNPIINGERHNISEWCKIYNISKESVYRRIRNGMEVIEAITAPKRR